MTIVQAPEQSRVAQWAVGLASAATGLVITDIAVLGVYTLFQGRIDDTWVGAIGVFVLFVGLLASFVAFALGFAARIKHDHWMGLRLPMSLFPILAALLLAGEFFWWE